MTLIKHLRAASIAVLIGIGGTALAVTAAQAADRIYTSLFSDVAVGGYDPVTYFTQSKALKGSKKIPDDA